MARLMMECLGRFVQNFGGHVAWSFRPDHNVVLNVGQESLLLEGEVRQFVREGYVFIYSERERIVASSMDEHDGTVTLGVRSDLDSGDFLRRWEDYARSHNYLLKRSFFADGELITSDRAYEWNDIVLPDNARRTISRHVEDFLASRQRLRGLGIKTRRGLILAGPPGTGKTLLGKVLARTLNDSFMWVMPRHVTDSKSFAHILGVARFVSPTVVFLEDLDLFGEERQNNRWLGLGELMNQLDGVAENNDIVTIATTNRLDVVEKALRNRPGRFDRIIEFEALNVDGRRTLLEKLLANCTISPEDVDYLVTKSNDYTGAQVQELANTLHILAAQQDGAKDTAPDPIMVSRELIEEAFDDFRFEKKGVFGFHSPGQELRDVG